MHGHGHSSAPVRVLQLDMGPTLHDHHPTDPTQRPNHLAAGAPWQRRHRATVGGACINDFQARRVLERVAPDRRAGRGDDDKPAVLSGRPRCTSCVFRARCDRWITRQEPTCLNQIRRGAAPPERSSRRLRMRRRERVATACRSPIHRRRTSTEPHIRRDGTPLRLRDSPSTRSCSGERLVGPPTGPVGVLAPLGGDHHGARLIEHGVVREARVAVVERLEAVHEPELVERGQAVLGGVPAALSAPRRCSVQDSRPHWQG